MPPSRSPRLSRADDIRRACITREPREGSNDRTARIFVAELIGTMILILGGPGTAMLATGKFGIDVGVLGVRSRSV